MSDSNRLRQLTLGGFLVGFLLIAGALAQEGAKEPLPPVNKGEGVTVQAPAPEVSGQHPAERQDSQAESPHKTGAPVGGQIDASDGCDQRCQEAIDREKADLVAQESMALSTYEMADISWWQAGIGGVGIVLLIATIVYTHKSYRLTATTAQRQLRAYVDVKETTISWGNGQTFEITIVIKNYGQTPAHNLQNMIWYTIGGEQNQPLSKPDKFQEGTISFAPLAEKTYTISSEPLEDTKWIMVRNRTTPLYVSGRLQYKDAFGESRRTNFHAFLDNGSEDLKVCSEGNYST